jgi:SPP1 gp7 family putative phage head morphogenesis protein
VKGYREDKLRKLARHLSASSAAEARYMLDVQGIMTAIHRGVMKVVEREHLAPPPVREDAQPFLGDRLAHRLFTWQAPRVIKAFNRMAGTVEKKSAEGATILGLDVTHVVGIQSVIEHARRENVNLITRASEAFLQQVRDVLDETRGQDVGDIREALRDRVDVSRSRAQFIARDQTLKLNGQINEHRQRSAGVAKYTWSTSHDERVRESHAALDGQVFSWDDPPETNDDGDTNNPGEDFSCRCVGVPYLEELDDVQAAEEPDSEAAEEE